MKRVITYGTYDLLHYGHINLLKRAKALGDYLIVAISTDEFNWNSKQKKCYFSYEQRKALVESIRYVDLVIPEESWEQKKSDMHEYHIDTFVIGDDWEGKFDFLKDEGVDVVFKVRQPLLHFLGLYRRVLPVRHCATPLFLINQISFSASNKYDFTRLPA